MNETNSNSILPADEDTLPVYVGYIALAVTVFFWGSFFLPVKKFQTGDGMFFQLFVCLGIWTVALIVNWIRNFPPFYPLAMLCGFTWVIGNACNVPIIKFIGMSLGPPLWGCTALIVGWANARFGFLGNKPQVPKSDWMNYLGVALAFVSCFFYIFVKSEVTKKTPGSDDEMPAADTNDAQKQRFQIEEKNKGVEEERSFIDDLNPTIKRVVGIILALFSGVMFGVNYVPILYIKDNYPNSSKNELDYLYSFCSGTLASSVILILVYCIIKKNKPIIYANIMLPGFISGVMWAIANLCYLIASTVLSQAVITPIGMPGPPMVATLWGILVFKEIRGKRNLIVLGFGFLFTISGAVFSGLSK